jgi:cell division protein FtsX
VLLFVYGYLGATTGLVSLPFDRHHIVSQLVGAVLAVVGLRWALSELP